MHDQMYDLSYLTSRLPHRQIWKILS